MLVSSSTRSKVHHRVANQAPPSQGQSQAQPESESRKDASKLTTPPNNRHHWDPDKAKWVRRLRDLAMPLAFRLKDEGFENIPKDGNMIVGPTHQFIFDAPIASRVPPEPHGSMSDVNQFHGVLGKMLSDFGSFPVDRWEEFDGDFPDPVEHAKEILNDDKNFIFYPEGRIYKDEVVYPLKTGIGRIAVGSKVKYALPVAQHYQKDEKSHPVEMAVGVALSAATAGAGIWAASQGGAPAVIAGALTGLVSGALVGGAAGFLAGPGDNKGKAAVKGLKWAGAGAAAGAVAAGVVGAVAPGAAPWVIGTTSALTGLAGLGLSYHWTHRTVAVTRVGESIEVEPYRQAAAASNDPEAEWKQSLKLTADFYEALKEVKKEVTGVESPFKMDDQGNRWGQQPDGSWVLVERNEDKEWVPVKPETPNAPKPD